MSLLSKEIEIEFQEMIRETTDIYSFVFNRPKELIWKPGQHATFKNLKCNGKGEKDNRIFSLASIVEEEKVMFSTRITPESTECKKKLLELEKGDKITIENPQGEFLLTEYDKPILMLAGGIGITPIRALLMSMDFKSINPENLVVLYSDDRGEFAYQDTLEWLDKKYDGLHLYLIPDRTVFMDKIKEISEEMGQDASYYISGTPGMNTAITNKLYEVGVGKDRIKTDNFIGY